MRLHAELQAMKFTLNISTYDVDALGNKAQGYGTMNSHNGSNCVRGFYYREYHSPSKLVIESEEGMRHLSHK